MGTSKISTAGYSYGNSADQTVTTVKNLTYAPNKITVRASGMNNTYTFYPATNKETSTHAERCEAVLPLINAIQEEQNTKTWSSVGGALTRQVGNNLVFEIPKDAKPSDADIATLIVSIQKWDDPVAEAKAEAEKKAKDGTTKADTDDTKKSDDTTSSDNATSSDDAEAAKKKAEAEAAKKKAEAEAALKKAAEAKKKAEEAEAAKKKAEAEAAAAAAAVPAVITPPPSFKYNTDEIAAGIKNRTLSPENLRQQFSHTFAVYAGSDDGSGTKA